jgi:hypothetical protein
MFVRTIPVTQYEMLIELDHKIKDRILELQQARDACEKAGQFLNAAKEERRRYEAIIVQEQCAGIPFSTARLSTDYNYLVVDTFS